MSPRDDVKANLAKRGTIDADAEFVAMGDEWLWALLTELEQAEAALKEAQRFREAVTSGFGFNASRPVAADVLVADRDRLKGLLRTVARESPVSAMRRGYQDVSIDLAAWAALQQEVSRG